MTPVQMLAETVRRSLARPLESLRLMVTRPLNPERWIFVVGSYNSGTTLIARLLAEHPDVGDLPFEGQFYTDQLPRPKDHGVPRLWTAREDLFRMIETSSGPDVDRIKRQWAVHIDNPAARYVLEKTPVNMARTRWLQANFKPASFIGVIRDPYAVIAGIRRKARVDGETGVWNAVQAANQWARSNDILRADVPALERFIWVRYEDFTERPVEERRRVMSFLDVPDIGGESIGAAIEIHERAEPVRNLNEESWRYLQPDDYRQINDAIGPIIESYGYPIRTAG